MYIALVNMLPVYPLDGGRHLAALEILMQTLYWANTVLNIALSIVLIFSAVWPRIPRRHSIWRFLVLLSLGRREKKRQFISEKRELWPLLSLYVSGT